MKSPLSFSNRRVIPAVDLEDSAARQRSWLQGVALTAADRQRFQESICRWLAPSLTDQQIDQGTYDELSPLLNGMPEIDVEWWDITDGETVHYQLWMFCGDSGVLFDVANNTMIVAVTQWELELEDAELARRLTDALQRAEKVPGSQLAELEIGEA